MQKMTTLQQRLCNFAASGKFTRWLIIWSSFWSALPAHKRADGWVSFQPGPVLSVHVLGIANAMWSLNQIA